MLKLAVRLLLLAGEEGFAPGVVNLALQDCQCR
jgi:hypothetical protein